MKAVCIPGLLEPRVHPIADTSLEAYRGVLADLEQRERAVLLALCEGPATGGELAERMGLPVTSIRPRLTELSERGMVSTLPARKSRFERSAHPYTLAVPRAAVERIR